MTQSIQLKLGSLIFTAFWTASMLWYSGSLHPLNVILMMLSGLAVGYGWYRAMSGWTMLLIAVIVLALYVHRRRSFARRRTANRSTEVSSNAGSTADIFPAIRRGITAALTDTIAVAISAGMAAAGIISARSAMPLVPIRRTGAACSNYALPYPLGLELCHRQWSAHISCRERLAFHPSSVSA